MHYFFENLLFYSWAKISQTMDIVMKAMEAYNKIVSFITPG